MSTIHSIQSSKALYIPERRRTNFARSPLLFDPRRKKTDGGQRSTFSSETSWFALLILAHRGSALPWLVDNRASLHPRIWLYPPDRALSGSTGQCLLPLACYQLPKSTKLELGRGAHLRNITHDQPYRRRISTDQMNRGDSQLAASLEGEPGPTSAGKTLPRPFKKKKISLIADGPHHYHPACGQ